MAVPNSAGAARTGRNPFLRAVAAISTVAGWCSAAMIVSAVGITCQMIFIRFVLNGSTIWQTEAVVYLMIAATLIGLPYVQRLRGHVNVDLFPLMLPMRARFALATLTLSLSIAIIIVCRLIVAHAGGRNLLSRLVAAFRFCVQNQGLFWGPFLLSQSPLGS